MRKPIASSYIDYEGPSASAELDLYVSDIFGHHNCLVEVVEVKVTGFKDHVFLEFPAGTFKYVNTVMTVTGAFDGDELYTGLTTDCITAFTVNLISDNEALNFLLVQSYLQIMKYLESQVLKN